MMWKDSYRLGVERIDEQHKELFRMTEDLVNAVQRGASVTEYQKVLEFLQDYVIYHFRDEEAYQASIQYEGLAAHQAEHRQFTQTVQQYEKRLTENGFEEKTMKDLAGTVTAWLIYHVVDTDQKILSGKKASAQEKQFSQYADLLSHHALDVMEAMAGLDRSSITQEQVDARKPQGDVFVKIQLVGDVKGEAVFMWTLLLAGWKSACWCENPIKIGKSRRGRKTWAAFGLWDNGAIDFYLLANAMAAWRTHSRR